MVTAVHAKPAGQDLSLGYIVSQRIVETVTIVGQRTACGLVTFQVAALEVKAPVFIDAGMVAMDSGYCLVGWADEVKRPCLIVDPIAPSTRRGNSIGRPSPALKLESPVFVVVAMGAVDVTQHLAGRTLVLEAGVKVRVVVDSSHAQQTDSGQYCQNSRQRRNTASHDGLERKPETISTDFYCFGGRDTSMAKFSLYIAYTLKLIVAVTA